MTESSKTDVFRELSARLNAGELSLYAHPQLLAELRRVRSRFQAHRASVFIPRVGGSHGDIAQALALATWEHRGGHSSAASAGAGTRESDGTLSRSELLRIRRERSSAGADFGDDVVPLRYGSEL